MLGEVQFLSSFLPHISCGVLTGNLLILSVYQYLSDKVELKTLLYWNVGVQNNR